MPDPDAGQPAGKKKIKIIPNGPYVVMGGIPLVHKTQVVSEFGEPLTWRKDGGVEFEEEKYYLCRCGKSGIMPYCDAIHREIDFDGTETANTAGPSDTLETFGGARLLVKNDPRLCMNSGFCGLRDTSLSQLVAAASDTKKRALAMAMIEHCPSGALTFKVEPGKADIEPDLPQEIAYTTEITADGPIAGPLWVTGSIEIERADGQPFEPRNRVTLCNCGLSVNKPLCDGTHRREAERLAKEAKTAK
jgi:CDGSH-type Zn-finger protein